MRQPRPLKPQQVQERPGRTPEGTVREMARLRQQLAEELEANLKQLRDVIEESQRIARELEAVLQQTRLAPVQVPTFPRRRPGQPSSDRDGEPGLQGAPGLPGGNEGRKNG